MNLHVTGQQTGLRSVLEIYDITTNEREFIYAENGHFEAPNWSRNGEFLLLNSHGKLFRLDHQTKKKTHIETGFALNINNDHGISPDGSTIVISSADPIKKADDEANNWLLSA